MRAIGYFEMSTPNTFHALSEQATNPFQCSFAVFYNYSFIGKCEFSIPTIRKRKSETEGGDIRSFKIRLRWPNQVSIWIIKNIDIPQQLVIFKQNPNRPLQKQTMRTANGLINRYTQFSLPPFPNAGTKSTQSSFGSMTKCKKISSLLRSLK